MTHALKTWPKYFKDIAFGDKAFELRKDDRPFKVGDTVLLQEYGTKNDGYVKDSYTGEELSKIISYILRDAPEIGLKNGYVIIGLRDVSLNQY